MSYQYSKPKLSHPWQWIDWLYMQTSKGKFFSQGWGDLGLIDKVVELGLLHSEPALIKPVFTEAPELYPQNDIRCYHYQFLSPVTLLPDEVKLARGCLIMPKGHGGIYDVPICVSMPGTGDEFYDRRVKTLAIPLAKQGIAT